MATPRSIPFRGLVFWGSLSAMAFLAAARIAQNDPSSWRWVAGTAVVTGLLFGPVAWIDRDRIPDARRERLALVATGLVLLCVPIVLGAGLDFGALLFVIDVLVLGGVLGFAASQVMEWTAVSERLRGATR